MRKKLFAKAKEVEKEPLDSQKKSSKKNQEEMLEKDGRKVSESLFYKLFVKTAYSILHKPLAVFRILKNSLEHLKKYESIREFAADTREKIELLTRMIRAYVKGEYKGISKTNIALSLAAIIYFVSPIDLIPDFLAAGLLDDLALLTWVYNNFTHEIEEFLLWEDEHKMIRIPIETGEENK
ncbi:YkvA family protein [Aureispira anguillae]|uniref:YkvA family protein n=1 Tax=Aureispira anguillae TaxID=2864201 RepID=A0A916DUE5_9BACT|nr:YkvA family protein [Aureispira anguillae]BDS12460.1 YkvA family protein [Aureispira anguillae]